MKRILVFISTILVCSSVYGKSNKMDNRNTIKKISPQNIPGYMKSLYTKHMTMGPYYMQSNAPANMQDHFSVKSSASHQNPIVLNPDTLCFSGGGAKGIAYSGVLKYLVEANKMENITRFVGTSAGSIAAGLFSLDWKGNYDRLESIISETDFSSFINKGQMYKKTNVITLLDILAGNKGYFGGLARWIMGNACGIINAEKNHYGICSGDAILDWFHSIFEEQGYDKFITFEELYQKTGNHLVLFSCCLTFRSTAVFDYINTPDFPVTLAMRASMAIPFFFSPVHTNYGGISAYFIDGGAANNYPIWYFDDDPSSQTLGFILSPESTFNPAEFTEYPTDNICDVIGGFFSIVLNNQATVMLQGNRYRSVFVDPGDIGTLSFSMNKEEKQQLIDTAYHATKEYFEGDRNHDYIEQYSESISF